MILNNIAQKNIDGTLKYDDIIDYINDRLFDNFYKKSNNIKVFYLWLKIKNHYA